MFTANLQARLQDVRIFENLIWYHKFSRVAVAWQQSMKAIKYNVNCVDNGVMGDKLEFISFLHLTTT